ncbi:amino acid permease [Rhodococcus opacus]|uniref:amino acid permease n=1 Tax=Rhodococcus opacus TaxID=37919 RepID=UPI002235F984|nr:amino acid permease [Rhodococcus opacus]UZG60205.1 amino acid permease [Rhodococcus opacus]
MNSSAAGSDQLHKSLKRRHLSMIALGGVIGAGLFVGSSVVLHEAGPAAFFSYAITGLLVVLVMRMLGEMAASDPSTGSFTGYAGTAFGPCARFTTGWIYWYSWVVGAGSEAVVGGKLLQRWVPLPSWIMAAALLVVMLAVNLRSVRNFGEFEYWFASIKVAVILVFLVMGVTFVLGLWPSQHGGPDISNLYAHGGFAPHGYAAVLPGVLVGFYSMVGSEVATIAAAESSEPVKSITRATNSVVARIVLFYLGSLIVLAAVVPWTSVEPGKSPFVEMLTVMGVPYGADVMNVVVLVAVLSCMNAGLYTSSRMVFALARFGDAPQSLVRTNRGGVPRNAVLLAGAVVIACIVLDYVSPDTVFAFLVNASGATFLLVYLIIAGSQIRLRMKMSREQTERLPVRMWLFPWLSILACAGMFAVLIAMFVMAPTRPQALATTGVVAGVLGTYLVHRRLAGAQKPPSVQAENRSDLIS